MRKKTLDRGILMLLVFTLFTLISWVGFEVYRTYAQIAIPDVSSYLVELNPNLDTTILGQLESRSP